MRGWQSLWCGGHIVAHTAALPIRVTNGMVAFVVMELSRCWFRSAGGQNWTIVVVTTKLNEEGCFGQNNMTWWLEESHSWVGEQSL